MKAFQQTAFFNNKWYPFMERLINNDSTVESYEHKKP
jgi:hypothetical protein